MPVDIVSTNASPYTVQTQTEVVSTHATQHKAIQAAIEYAEACRCEARVTQPFELRVTYTPPESGEQCEPKETVINWQPPQARASGADLPLDAIAGYRIKTTWANGEHIQEVGNYTEFASPLLPGEYNFEVATKDSAGLWSEYSSPYRLGF